MKMLLIAEPGDSVDDMARGACNLALQTGWFVELVHNERHVVVTVGEMPARVADRIRKTAPTADDDRLADSGPPIAAFITGFNNAIKQRLGK